MKEKKIPFTGGNPTRLLTYSLPRPKTTKLPFSLNTGEADSVSSKPLHLSVPLVHQSLLNLAEPSCVLCVGCSLLKTLLYLEQQYLSCRVVQCPDFQMLQAVFDQDWYGHPTVERK